MSDNELGRFLRDRREALPPGRAGLPSGPRRRTPGLRRAELATLAGVSVEYVTRLEQGRDRHPSAQVLAALADALRLTPEERVHLYRLSKSAEGGFSCMGPEGDFSGTGGGGAAPASTVRPAVRALLDRLEPTPALLLDRAGDVLAATDGFRRLAEPLGLLEGDEPPNLVRFLFTDDRAREVWPDWEQVADDAVAALKQGPFRADPRLARFADELAVTAGRAFTDRVERVTGPPRASGVQRLAHPGAGELRLAYETLGLPADDDLRLLIYLPADDATTAALDRLTAPAPLALRAVPA